jgi:hypothetical protein
VEVWRKDAGGGSNKLQQTDKRQVRRGGSRLRLRQPVTNRSPGTGTRLAAAAGETTNGGRDRAADAVCRGGSESECEDS